MDEQLSAGTASAVESDSSSSDSYLPENYLSDPGDSGETESEQSVAGGEDIGEDADSGEQQQAPQKVHPLEDRIQALAKVYGVDANDPKQRKMLEALATVEKRNGDKDAHIAKLQKLTPFEESLRQREEQGERGQQSEGQQFGKADVPATQDWKDPFPHWHHPMPEIARARALEDFTTALTEAVEKKDFTKAGAVFQEMFRREMHPYRDAIREMIHEGISSFERERLGDVLPSVRKTAAEHAAAETRQFAEKQLRTDAQFSADLDQLRKPLSDKMHEFEGEQYPDTMLNRIVLEKPHILHIKVNHPDPKTAQILTHMEQLRAIRREMASQKASPAKGKELVKAGAEMARRESGRERARQTLNGGSSSGGNSNPANNDYVAHIESSRPKRLSDFINK